MHMCAKKQILKDNSRCWQGLKELSCGVRGKGPTRFSEFFSRVFLFYSEKTIYVLLLQCKFSFKTSSALICKKGAERERLVYPVFDQNTGRILRKPVVM